MVLAEALHVRARLVVECCLDPVSKELVEALQFPHVKTRNVHHVDRVYPQALLSAKELRAAGLDQDEVGRLQALRDSLPNLQLLEMSGNISKSATVPSVWATSLYRSREAYEAYLERNEIPWLPASPKEFERFFTCETRWSFASTCDF